MLRIAIDGPGGAGKSSVAKAIAKRLGIIYVDTGALYRTIGLYMLKQGINPGDAHEVVKRLNDFTLELKFIDGKQVILLNGEDVGDTIRAPEVSMAASAVSAIGEVREYLLNTQRSIAEKNSVIMDGRDIGTVILPKAEVKIFLTASKEARAMRRYNELIAKGREVTYEDVYREMVERDTNDSTRDIAPCVAAKDAVLLDNSDLDFDGTVEAILKIVEKKTKKRRPFYMWMHLIIALPIRLLNRVTIVGKENIPIEGGYIICANHIAARDVFLIGACCPRHICFLAKAELFKIPIVGSFMKLMGAVKINRSGGDVAAIRKTIELLDDGKLVAIFPQGHRNPGVNPANTEIKSGTGLIAYRSGVDILPAFIQVKDNKYGFFRKVTLIFGKPIKNSELGIKAGRNNEYKEATRKIFCEVIALGGYELPSAEADKEM